MYLVVVVLPDPFLNEGVEELHGDPTVGATPQSLNQRSKMEEVVPKMARRRGSDAGQSRWR